MNKELARDVEEYYRLKQQHKMLEGRLKHLNGKIKKAVIEATQGGKLGPDTFHESISYFGAEPYHVEIKPTDRQPSVDKGLLEQLFVRKGLWSAYHVETIPDGALQEAYLNNQITVQEYNEVCEDPAPKFAMTIGVIATNV